MPTDPTATLFGALACWGLAGVAIRIGWDATFRPESLWIAYICISLSSILLVLCIVLLALGLVGFLWSI